MTRCPAIASRADGQPAYENAPPRRRAKKHAAQTGTKPGFWARLMGRG